jgi:hypothetical protein
MSTDGGINIPVGADLAQFARDLDELPRDMAGKLRMAAEKIRAQISANMAGIARTRLEIKAEADPTEVQRLTTWIEGYTRANEQLAAKLEVVAVAAQRKAQAVRAAATAEQAALAATVTATTHVDAGMKSAKVNSGNLAMGFMQLAQGAEDLQYSIGGAMNNMASAAVMFGASAGLATGVTLVGVLVNQLVRNWDDLTEAFGGGAVRSQAEQMAELAKQTSLTAQETRRLKEYEEERQQIEGMKGGKPEKVREAESEVQAAIDEAGGRDAVAAIIARLRRDKAGLDKAAAGYEEYRQAKAEPETIEVMSQETGETFRHKNEGRLERMQAALEKNQKDSFDQALRELNRAKNNQPAGLEELIKRVQAAPQLFPADFLERLQAATPERKTKDEAIEAAGNELDRSNESWKAFQERRQAYQRAERRREREATETAEAEEKARTEPMERARKLVLERHQGGGTRSESLSGVDYANRLIGAGLEGRAQDQIQKDILEETRRQSQLMADQNKAIKDLPKEIGRLSVARFG